MVLSSIRPIADVGTQVTAFMLRQPGLEPGCVNHEHRDWARMSAAAKQIQREYEIRGRFLCANVCFVDPPQCDSRGRPYGCEVQFSFVL